MDVSDVTSSLVTSLLDPYEKKTESNLITYPLAAQLVVLRLAHRHFVCPSRLDPVPITHSVD